MQDALRQQKDSTSTTEREKRALEAQLAERTLVAEQRERELRLHRTAAERAERQLVDEAQPTVSRLQQRVAELERELASAAKSEGAGVGTGRPSMDGEGASDLAAMRLAKWELDKKTQRRIDTLQGKVTSLEQALTQAQAQAEQYKALAGKLEQRVNTTAKPPRAASELETELRQLRAQLAAAGEPAALAVKLTAAEQAAAQAQRAADERAADIARIKTEHDQLAAKHRDALRRLKSAGDAATAGPSAAAQKEQTQATLLLRTDLDRVKLAYRAEKEAADKLRKEMERLQSGKEGSKDGALAAEVAQLRATNAQLREELAVFGEPEFLASIEQDQLRVAQYEAELRALAREYQVPVSVAL